MLKIVLMLTNIALFATALFMGYTLYRIQGSGEPSLVAARPLGEEKPLPVSTVKPEVGIKPVIDRNLFKAIPVKADKTAATVESQKPPEATKLNLKLWGTMVQNSGEPFAVIEDGIEKKQHLYRTGDTIQDAEIKEIAREKVMLNVQGRSEFLLIEQSRGGGASRSAAPSQPAASVPAGAAKTLSSPGAAGTQPPGTGFAGDAPTVVPRIRGSAPGQRSFSSTPGAASRIRLPPATQGTQKPGEPNSSSYTQKGE